MPHKTARSDYIATPVIRGAYFYIHEKRTKDGNGQAIPAEKQRHEFVGLVPKLNNDSMQCPNYKIFSDLAMQAISRCTDFGGQFPAGGNWPIQDGDNPAKLAKSPWRAGCWIVKFSANFAPKVCVRQNGTDMEIPARRVGMQDMYKGGDYCIVSTNAFTYDDRAKGVKFNFDGILFVGVGEAIGTAARSVQQMFGGSTATPQPAPAPAPSYAPQYAPPPVAAAPAGLPPMPAAAPAPAPQYAPPPVAAAPAAPVYAPPPIPGAAPAGLPPIPGR
ncbi:ssDNA-binding protein [Bradyrhizobium sp. HKCCYLS2038]|uniref:ssDNA-binding protein n=1 Tax=Bradyrhizobium sp. HKCCYLS2038 TaxID=3420764 RepID=UPI003EB9DAC7